MGKPRATRVQTVRIFSRCLKIVGRISEPAQKKRGQKVSLVLGEQMRQFARVARGQSGQLFSLVLGEKVRRVAPGKKSGPVDLSGQTRAGLQKRPDRLSAAPTYTLGTFNAARDLQCRTPRTCRARATVPECRRMSQKTMRPRRTARLRRSALLFRLERTRKGAFRFGPCLPRQAFWSCPRPHVDRVSGRTILARSSARL